MRKLSGTRRLQIITFITGLFIAGFIAGNVTAQAEDPQTEIITDKNTNTVSFIIDGETMVLIDRNGLHVKADIEYGGTISDMGSNNAISIQEKKETDDEE